MLIGEFTHILDSKKRLAVPAKLRKELGERAVITRGLDQCLFLYPQSEWDKLAEKLGQLPLGQGDTRSFVRLMLAGAAEVEFDSLGRILIPEHLKKYADLKQKVIVVGVFNRLEIWDSSSWDTYRKKAESNTDDLAEKLGQLGSF